jgi:hypothetical protein
MEEHASLAVAWASASMGSLLEHEVAAVDMYFMAIEHLRSCFDVANESVLRAYIAVAYCAYSQGDWEGYVRYSSFANVIYGEIEGEVSTETSVCLYKILSQIPGEEPHPADQFSVQKAHSLPFNLQLPYYYSYATYLLDKLVRQFNNTPEQIFETCSRILRLCQPVLDQMQQLPSIGSPYAHFTARAVALFSWASVGNTYKSKELSRELLQLLHNKRGLLGMLQVWKAGALLVPFLRSLGFEEAEELNSLLSSRMYFAPLLPRDQISSFVQARDMEAKRV